MLLLSCACIAFAQRNSVDSLTAAYKKNRQDTTLIALLFEKSAKVYLTTNPGSGMYCARRGLAISRKIHYEKGEVEALTLIATCKTDSCLYFAKQAKERDWVYL
jgi:hypothetical protein